MQSRVLRNCIRYLLKTVAKLVSFLFTKLKLRINKYMDTKPIRVGVATHSRLSVNAQKSARSLQELANMLLNYSLTKLEKDELELVDPQIKEQKKGSHK